MAFKLPVISEGVIVRFWLMTYSDRCQIGRVLQDLRGKEKNPTGWLL